MNEIREQIRWLREGVAGGHAITIADSLEKLLAVYEAAEIWERDENRTDETEHNLIMAVQNFAQTRQQWCDCPPKTCKGGEITTCRTWSPNIHEPTADSSRILDTVAETRKGLEACAGEGQCSHGVTIGQFCAICPEGNAVGEGQNK